LYPFLVFYTRCANEFPRADPFTYLIIKTSAAVSPTHNYLLRYLVLPQDSIAEEKPCRWIRPAGQFLLPEGSKNGG
jgi:hypothetical protein